MDLTFYEGLAAELIGQLGRIGSFTEHGPSVGVYHEELIKSCISGLLSNRFTLRTGFAFLENGKVSDQGDILIVDEYDPAPYFFQRGNFVVVHPRALAAVIEVKTKLTKTKFLNSMNNLYSFKRIRAHGNFPVTLLFSFDGSQLSPKNLDSWYKSVDVPDSLENYPQMIFCLSRGTLFLTAGNRGPIFGHHFVVGEEDNPQKVKGLSMFLQTVRKAVERKSGIESNPFDYAILKDLRFSVNSCRFGKGLCEPNA